MDIQKDMCHLGLALGTRLLSNSDLHKWQFNTQLQRLQIPHQSGYDSTASNVHNVQRFIDCQGQLTVKQVLIWRCAFAAISTLVALQFQTK